MNKLSFMTHAAERGEKAEVNSDAEPGGDTALVAVVALGLQTAPNVRLGVLHGMVDSASIPDFSEPMPEEELRRWGG